MSYRCQYLLTRHIWYWRRCDVVVFTGTQYSSSSIEVWKMGNSLQTARLTFKMLCVMVKLNLKNRTFHIWYSMTVDKTLTHILTSSLLSSALSHFSEEKWGIYFVYLCNSRFAQCYLYNWVKFGTIYSQTGDCGEPWNLANCAAECQNLLWKTVGPSDYCSDVFWGDGNS